MVAFGVASLVAAASAQQVRPPVAKKVPHAETLHGDKRVDDYFWLRDKGSKEVSAYLTAEAAYADAVMKPTAALQETLYRELLGRIKEDDTTAPYPERGYLYYKRTEKGKQYPAYCRKAQRPTVPADAREEVLIDLNVLGAKEKFISAGGLHVSDNGQLLAYSTDVTGFRDYILYVKDLRTGELGPEKIAHVTSFTWAHDGKTLFYVLEDKAKRPYQLWRHALGEAKDTLVYEEKDERFITWIGRSRSRAWLFLGVGSHTQSEIRYLSAAEPAGTWKVIAPREKDHEYYVDHRGNDFYIRTNKGGRNFRVVTAPVSDPSPAKWKELVPHRENVMIEDANLFAQHLVLSEREDGLSQLRVTDLRTSQSHRISFPEQVYEVSQDRNEEFDTRTFRFEYESFTTPPTTFDYGLDKRERTLVKRREVLGGYDPTRYQAERIRATAPDGTRVPISLVYKRGTVKDGTSPMLLTGYGSYGIPYTINFDSDIVSLLDRGVIFAIAHIRGGGDLGKKWHDSGRMLQKRNTFTDFIACAEHLIAQRYTASDRLAIEGASAGGLLMGAVANLRPDLFRAVLARVPFVDVINTMLDESLPLTVGEFEEWGNPKVKPEYDYMKSYSPYDNVAPRAYPTMLVKTSLNDSQVMYWEPAKWVARLRALKTDPNPLVFKINLDPAGHGGASGRYDKLRETAFNYAFLLTHLGVAK